MADSSGYSKFIEAVAGDGKTAPDVRVLGGWLGPAADDATVRLYLDSSLGVYLDIARDAVLYSEEVPNSHPAGASTMWVRSDAELREGGSALARAAKFLSGPVQQFGAFGVQRTVPITITASGPLCPMTTIGCPDPNPSVQQACATLKPALCPSAPQACPMPTPQVQAAAFGWTSLGCNRPTNYPQCNSSVGVCATRPPCF